MEKYTTTHRIRFLLGEWTQKEFAEYFHIDYRKVTNWDARQHFPVWLEDIFDMYVLPVVLGMTLEDYFQSDHSDQSVDDVGPDDEDVTPGGEYLQPPPQS